MTPEQHQVIFNAIKVLTEKVTTFHATHDEKSTGIQDDIHEIKKDIKGLGGIISAHDTRLTTLETTAAVEDKQEEKYEAKGRRKSDFLIKKWSLIITVASLIYAVLVSING